MSNKELDTLRQEIDAVDQEIHRLLIRRTELVLSIGDNKRNGDGEQGQAPVYLRTGREAELLRRRLAAHEGPLPRGVVARVWRELIGAACLMQSPFRVAVFAPERSAGYWDLARNHYGSSVSMSLVTSAQGALREVSEGKSLGVLPAWSDGESDPWWPLLVPAGDVTLHVICRLPFYESATGRFENFAAFVVAPFPPEASGDDLSLAVVRVDESVSRARLLDKFKAAGLEARVVAVNNDPGGAGLTNLVELDGYLDGDDRRLAALSENEDGAVTGVAVIGAYARPVGSLV